MTETTLESPPQQGETPPGAAPAFPEKPEVSSVRLVLTLGVAGILAGLLLVLVYKATEPTITANKAAAVKRAVNEVLHLRGTDRFETLYVHEGSLLTELPAGVSEKGVELIFLGYDAENKPVGFAITHGEPCFQDIVRVIFGFDPGTSSVLGMKVLESKETPGLGDKIEKDEVWVAQFNGVVAPMIPVKPGRGTKDARDEVDTITGATISTKGVVRIINNKLEQLRPLLEQHWAEVSS